MSYFPSIPQASDDPSVSQGEILTNFGTIGTQFAVNHVAFGAISGAGKHKFLEMPNQSVIPAGLSANEGTLYTKAVVRSAVTTSEMFYTPDATADEYQLSQIVTANKATFSTNPGWVFLPGGILLQWGTVAGSAANTTAVTFPVAYVNVVYNVQITPIRAATSPGDSFATVIVTATKSTSGFTIGNIGSHTMQGWDWIAIGK